jgi:hypothetical protein
MRDGRAGEATWAIREVKFFGADPEIVQALKKCLTQDDSAVRRAALGVLRDFGMDDLRAVEAD